MPPRARVPPLPPPRCGGAPIRCFALPPSTLLAPVAYPPVFADAGTSTLLAPAASSPVFTDAGSSTLFALAASSIVLTDADPSAVLAPVASSPVFTDAGSSTLLDTRCVVDCAHRCRSLHSPCTGCVVARVHTEEMACLRASAKTARQLRLECACSSRRQ